MPPGFGVPQAEAKVKPTVDKRGELLSIVARLAGFSEYQSDFNKEYVNQAIRDFSGFPISSDYWIFTKKTENPILLWEPFFHVIRNFFKLERGPFFPSQSRVH